MFRSAQKAANFTCFREECQNDLTRETIPTRKSSAQASGFIKNRQ